MCYFKLDRTLSQQSFETIEENPDDLAIIDQIKANLAQMLKDCEKIQRDCAQLRIGFAKVRADQVTIRAGIEKEEKFNHDTSIFYKEVRERITALELGQK